MVDMKYRIAKYEYEIQGNYGYGYETVTTEETRKEAFLRLKEYRENEPGVAFKLVKVKA